MQIAVLIPLCRETITPDEQVSLRNLNHFLSAFQRIVIKPKSLTKALQGCETFTFSDYHFSSIDSYSRLLLSTSFYEAFAAFDYVLIFQLDCLVFSDDLIEWCQLGYDYIGAPLFHDKTDPQSGFSRVGNGGLSLRKVGGFLKVLSSPHTPSWRDVLTTSLPDLYRFSWPYRWLKKLRVFRDAHRGVQWYTQHYSLNEDLFWSDRAKLFDPSFKIAPVETALGFAFDAHPRYCFEQNHHQFPFGCHAWAKWDRAFWEPYLKSDHANILSL